MTSTIMRMTTSIVTSHMSNNKMPSGDVVGLIESVFQSLVKLEDDYLKGHPEAFQDAPRAPAIAAASPQVAPVATEAPAVEPASAPAPKSALRKRTEAAAPAAATPSVAATVVEAAPAAAATLFAETEAPKRELVTRRSAASPQITKRDIKDPADQVDPERWPGVYKDKIVCLEDHAEVTLLKAYLNNRFRMTLDQYREKWNLPDDYPNAPPAYSEGKRKQAKTAGLGLKVRSKKAKKVDAPKEKRGRKPGTLSPAYRSIGAN